MLDTSGASRTIIHVAIQLSNNRDRRRGNTYDRARQLFASLQSYFMAQKYDGTFAQNEAKASPTFGKRMLDMLHFWGHPPRT